MTTITGTTETHVSLFWLISLKLWYLFNPPPPNLFHKFVFHEGIECMTFYLSWKRKSKRSRLLGAFVCSNPTPRARPVFAWVCVRVCVISSCSPEVYSCSKIKEQLLLMLLTHFGIAESLFFFIYLFYFQRKICVMSTGLRDQQWSTERRKTWLHLPSVIATSKTKVDESNHPFSSFWTLF